MINEYVVVGQQANSPLSPLAPSCFGQCAEEVTSLASNWPLLLAIRSQPISPDVAAWDGGKELQHEHWRHHNPAPAWQHHLIGAYILLLSVVAVLGNLLVIWTCIRFRSLRTSSNLLVVNLAVGDLLMCAVDFPIFALASFQQQWPFGRTVCQTYASLTGVAGLVTINTLASISLDRYRAVSRRLNPSQPRPLRATMLVASCIWAYSLPWALAPFLGWGRYVLDGIGTTCTFDFFSRSLNNISFVLAITVGNFVLPLGIIVFSYSGIWVVVRSTHVSLLRQGNVAVSLGTRRQRLGFQSDLKTAIIILAIVAAFLLAWLPYLVICFLGLFGDRSRVTVQVSVLASIVAKTSTALNPVLYSISHPKVRRKLNILFLHFVPPRIRRFTQSTSFSGLQGEGIRQV